jgi:hypothetical protein
VEKTYGREQDFDELFEKLPDGDSDNKSGHNTGYISGWAN